MAFQSGIRHVYRELMSFSREQKCNYLSAKSYFDKSLVVNKDIHWLFILTFPNGGSTALAKLLLTASAATELSDNAEGQWLIPSLSANRKRWDRNHTIPPRKLRASWLDKIGSTENKPTLVVEKSPANMSRYRYILSTFSDMKCSLVTYTRDPYAVCASWHSRYGPDMIHETWLANDRPKPKSDEEYFGLLADIWLERAEMIIKARRHSVFDLSYEKFTRDIEGQMNKFKSFIPELNDMSHDAAVKVKDYLPQKISNMNEKHIKSLTREQRSSISKSLSKSPDILDELGYSLQ
ncbi:MAG: sulfotransferase [Pseudomonadota bacterium]